MPNLIAGRRVVPELIQSGFTAENVVRELTAIIADGPVRRQMQEGFRKYSNVCAITKAANHRP